MHVGVLASGMVRWPDVVRWPDALVRRPDVIESTDTSGSASLEVFLCSSDPSVEWPELVEFMEVLGLTSLGILSRPFDS